GGKLGLGHAAVRSLHGIPPAASASLTLGAARELLDSLRAIGGKGSAARRQALLAELFAAATAPEQDFLARLLLDELRQGALEGVMADAIAEAAGIPSPGVRRALMLGGGVAPVAAAALEHGEAGLAAFR